MTISYIHGPSLPSEMHVAIGRSASFGMSFLHFRYLRPVVTRVFRSSIKVIG